MLIANDVAIEKLNLEENEDDDLPQPPDNTKEDVNPNESNISEESHSFDGEITWSWPNIGSLDINYGCCHVDAICVFILKLIYGLM